MGVYGVRASELPSLAGKLHSRWCKSSLWSWEATLALRLSLQGEDSGWQQAWKAAGRQAGDMADKWVAQEGKVEERK